MTFWKMQEQYPLRKPKKKRMLSMTNSVLFKTVNIYQTLIRKLKNGVRMDFLMKAFSLSWLS